MDALITPAHTVIEFGARFGTTSCRLCRATRNSGRVVSVEPQHTSCIRFDAIQNRERNRCAFHLVGGATVGDTPLKLGGVDPGDRRGYSMHTRSSAQGERESNMLPNWDFRSLEKLIGSRFNAALIDCEGCMRHALSNGLLQQLDLILLEEDGKPDPPGALITQPAQETVSTHSTAAAASASMSGGTSLSNDAPHARRSERLATAKGGGGKDAGSSIRAYAGWRAYLKSQGFVQVWRSQDTVGRGRWSSQIAHSAWRRAPSDAGPFPPVSIVDECRRAMVATKLPRSLLRCAPYSDLHLWGPF